MGAVVYGEGHVAVREACMLAGVACRHVAWGRHVACPPPILECTLWCQGGAAQ